MKGLARAAATVFISFFAGCGQLAAQTPQTITFDPIPARIFGISPFAIAAQASSGLPVGFASTTPAVCTTASVLVTLLSTGTCSIVASQGGNGSFGAATPVTRSFSVNRAAASSGLSAPPGNPFAVGSNPESVVVGDFNGDGIPDFAVANLNDSTVTVLLGNGSGGFTPATNSPFPVGSSPYYIVVGDFNGDGFQDLATVNGNSNNVTVLLGNGAGGFAAAGGSPFAVGSFPVSLTVGDFNGDGIQDLAVSNFTDSTVTVLLGNGSGGFAAAAGSPIAVGTNPAGIVVADFNGDSKQDLAVSNYNGSNVTVLLGNGLGAFTAATNSPFAAGTNPPSLVVNDFNGDGIPDLAVANFTDSTVTVLLGDGLGGFAAPAGSPFTVGTNPFSIVAGDFNGDGIPDLATANDGSNNVTVLLGNGSGGFAASPGSPYAVGINPVSLAVADFNGDGLLDLAASNGGGNNVTVLLGVGTTAQMITFGPLSGVTVGIAPFTISATATSGLAVTFTSTTPAGCTVSGATVTIVAAGTCSITASQAGNATYAAATPVTQSFTVSGPPPPPPPTPVTINNLGNLGEIALGSSFFISFTASGGTPPYIWSASNLPAGLTLNASSGALTGTPAAPGNFKFTVTVTDSASPKATASLAATLQVLGITTSSSLPPARVGGAYSQTFTAMGGSGTYTFSSSNAPPGLAVSGTTLAGIPTTAGTFTFQVQAADGSGVTASASFSLVVVSALSITSASNPGELAFGSFVADILAATGGKQPYTWSATGMPAGVTLNSINGSLSGNPSQPGNYNFTVQVSDSETPPATTKLALTLQVLGLTTSAALPDGATTAVYSLAFSAAGGTGPYIFSSPDLPPGLAFSGATLTGAPTTVGSYLFKVRVQDATGFTTSSAFSLIVTGPATPLNISGRALPGGAAGATYSQALTGTGGAPPYTWTIVGGGLPLGLSLNASSGEILGTPSATGTFAFTARATDNSSNFASAVFTIAIAPLPLAISGLPFPNGIVGADYPLQIPAGSGGVPPYTFTVSSGSLPPGLSLAGGEIGGIPTASGTSSFTITMADSESPPLTIASATQIVISSAAAANLLLSAGSVSFTLTAGASGLPAPASVTVQSSVVQDLLNYSAAAIPAVSWLDVTGGGSTPGSLGIALDPTAINLGPSSVPLTTGILVTCLAPSPCAGQSQTIQLSLSLTAPPPLLTFTTNQAEFSTSASVAAPLSQQIAIQNVGGGSAFITSASAADPWLTVSGVPASVSPGPPVSITLTANPAGLGAGFFRTTVTIQSSSGTISLPVTLEIAKIQTLSLSISGAQFHSTLGSAPLNTASSFLVEVTAGLPVNWTASVLPGASWLQLSALTTGGSANSSSPGTVSYHLAPAALTQAQTYYGTIQITAQGVTNSPLNYLVVLTVAAATALPVADPQPAGLLFQTVAGSSTPASQTVTVYASSLNGVTYSAAASTTDGIAWLSVSPGTGTSSGAASAGVSTVSVSPGTLPAGVYTGSVSYQLSAAVVRSVNVTMIVLPSGAATPASRPVALQTARGCTPAQLVPTHTGLVNNFAQPASLPTPLSVTVVNNCGAAVGNGQVIATFSNGDPPLVLGSVSAAAGLYSGTWTPRAVSAQVTVTATVTAPGFSSSAAAITGKVVSSAAPLLAPGGVLHIFNPQVGAALGPGTVLQIYGANMSASPVMAATLPLATTLGGTSVTIGGILAPLYYVSPDQIDAQLPYELTPGNSYQVIVINNGAVSMPDAIQVTTATPGVAAFATGQIVAQHPDYTLVTETSPAAPGEYLVIYLSGLGLTNHSIADGSPAPDTPLSTPLLAPTLTLNGAGIPIYFSGLTPGYVGLYQINFQVPPNTPNGDMELVISQGGASGNAAILPVHN